MRKCEKCNSIENDEVKIHEHHLKPKWSGGSDKDGRVWLCESCHVKLHRKLSELIKKWTVKWLDEPD